MLILNDHGPHTVAPVPIGEVRDGGATVMFGQSGDQLAMLIRDRTTGTVIQVHVDLAKVENMVQLARVQQQMHG